MNPFSKDCFLASCHHLSGMKEPVIAAMADILFVFVILPCHKQQILSSKAFQTINNGYKGIILVCQCARFCGLAFFGAILNIHSLPSCSLFAPVDLPAWIKCDMSTYLTSLHMKSMTFTPLPSYTALLIRMQLQGEWKKMCSSV